VRLSITFKTPDVVEQAVREKVDYEVGCLRIDPEDFEYVVQETCNKLSKWFRYGEYVTLDIDTDAGSITVMENNYG
jgi:hypothetical protein